MAKMTAISYRRIQGQHDEVVVTADGGHPPGVIIDAPRLGNPGQKTACKGVDGEYSDQDQGPDTGVESLQETQRIQVVTGDDQAERDHHHQGERGPVARQPHAGLQVGNFFPAPQSFDQVGQDADQPPQVQDGEDGEHDDQDVVDG